MCRLFLIHSEIPELAEITAVVLSYISHELGNQHGYFAMASESFGKPAKAIRTMLFDKYIRTLLTWWNENEKPRVACCHLRLASAGSISLENVHGFEVQVKGKKYRLAMNGHYGRYDEVQEYYYYNNTRSSNRNGKSDTAILAYFINKHGDIIEGLQAFRERYSGWGTTFVVSEDFTDMYLIVDNHECYLYELHFIEPVQGTVHVLTSMKDIVEKLAENQRVLVKAEGKCKDKRKIWFVENTVKTVIRKLYTYRIGDIYYTQIPDGVYHVDFLNNTLEKLLDLK